MENTQKQALLINEANKKEAENAYNYYKKHKDDDDLLNLVKKK